MLSARSIIAAPRMARPAVAQSRMLPVCAVGKQALIDAIAQKTDLTKKDSEKFLTAMIESIEEALVKGDAVSEGGLGSLGGNNPSCACNCWLLALRGVPPTR